MKLFKFTSANAAGCVLAICIGLTISPAMAVSAGASISHAALSRTVLLNAAYSGETAIAVSNQGDILWQDRNGIDWHYAITPTSGPLTSISFNSVKLGVAVGHRATVLRTVDGGASWQRCTVAIDSHSTLLDVIVLDEQQVIAIGAFGLYLRSGDGGLHWVREELSKDDAHFNAIARDQNNRLVIVGENGLVYRSLDMGRSWMSISSGTKASLLGVVSSGPDRFTAFGVAGTVITSIDGGLTWEPLTTDTNSVLTGAVALDGGAVAIVSAAGNTLFAAKERTAFKTINSQVGLSYSSVLRSGKDGLLIFGVNGINRLTVPAGMGN